MTEHETNTLRLGLRELNALLDKIDDVNTTFENPDREFKRWSFRVERVMLTIEHSTGSKVELAVATRNISRGGLAALHSSYVYPGSHCHVYVQLESSQILDVPAKVTRCSHLGGKVHEIGIQFNEEISTKDLLGLDPMQEAYSLERIHPSALRGSVLIVTQSEFDQQVFMKLLEDTSLNILVAEDSESALSRAQKGCDLILTDQSLGAETAPQVLMKLRAAGIDAPVVVLTSDPSSELRDEMRMSGASGMLTKPFSSTRLMQAMAEFILSDGDTGPLYSTLSESNPMYELLSKFLSDIPRITLSLEKSIRDSDYDTCRAICSSLSTTAGPLGFSPVADFAANAERALTQDSGTRDASANIRQLIIACRRVKAPPHKAA
ncbi:MAG: response regulator [Phycisphaerales bacterium]